MKRKSSWTKLFASLVFAASLGFGTGAAQTQPATEPSSTISVTGCLVRGDEPNEVWLAKKDGTIYGVESSKIDLNAHLGHRVMVRGYALPQGEELAGEEERKQNKTGKTETADFHVLTLKMIRTTCTH